MKSIETFSELAVRDLVLYSSWPPELASSFSALAPALELELEEEVELVVGVSLVVAALVAGVSAGVEDELLFELPQPARAATPISKDRAASAR